MDNLLEEKDLLENHFIIKDIIETYYKNIINDELDPFDSILKYVDPDKLISFFQKIIQTKNTEMSGDFREFSILMNISEESYYQISLFLFIAESIESISTRDALLFYEEAIIAAEENNEIELKKYAFKKLAHKSINDREYKKAKSFYNFVFFNRSRKVDFSCNSFGKCCKSFDVNITPDDINLILENKPELPIKDFIYIKEESPFNGYLKDNQKIIKEKADYQMYLKNKTNKGKECIFLENDLCSIHNYKPLTCKIWPNSMNTDNKISYQHLSFLNKECKYTVEPNKNEPNSIEEKLRESDYNFRSFRLNSYKIFEDLNNTENINNFSEIVNLYTSEVKKENNVIYQINKLFPKIADILSVTIKHNLKKLELENKSELIITVICEEKNKQKIKNKLFKEVEFLDISNLFKKNEIISISLNNFAKSIKIKFISRDKYKGFEIAEKVLYSKKDYKVPIRRKINYVESYLVINNIIESAKILIRYYLNQENYSEIKETFKEVFNFYKIIEKKSENIDLIEKITHDYNKLIKFYFRLLFNEKNETIYYSEYLYFENNLIKILKTNKKLNLTFIFENIKYLSKYESNKSVEKLIRRYFKLLEDDDYYYANKIIKFFNKNKINCSDDINKEICLISYSLYDLAFDQGNDIKSVLYLETLLQYYKVGFFELLDELIPEILINLLRLIINQNDLMKVEPLISKIELVYQEKKKSEVINQFINQLIISGNYKQAIKIFNKTIEPKDNAPFSKELFSKNSFMLNSLNFKIKEINIDQKRFSKINQLIKNKKDLEKNDLSALEQYFQSLINYRYETSTDRLSLIKAKLINFKDLYQENNAFIFFNLLIEFFSFSKQLYLNSLEKEIFLIAINDSKLLKPFILILCNNELNKVSKSLEEINEMSDIDSVLKSLYSKYLSSKQNDLSELKGITNQNLREIYEFYCEYNNILEKLESTQLDEKFNSELFCTMIDIRLFEEKKLIEMTKIINKYLDSILEL